MSLHNCIIITMFSFQGALEFLLRNSMKFLVAKELQSISYDSLGWWRLAGSNRWPPACKAGALPAELNPHIHSQLKMENGKLKFFNFQLSILNYFEVVGQNGLEPSTSRLSVVCSSQLSYWPISTSHFSKVHFPLYPLNWIMWNAFPLCTDLRTLQEENSFSLKSP